MPKSQSPFSNLLAFLLPIGVTAFIFVQVINSNPTYKQKLQNLISNKKVTNSTTKELVRGTNKNTYNVLASETSAPTPTQTSNSLNTNIVDTTKTTSQNQTENNNTITETDKKSFLTYVIDNIKSITNSPKTYFSKLQFEGRSSKPDTTDLLGDNNSYLWVQSDSDKIYLQSGQGGDSIQVLTEKLFNRDTTFKKNLTIKKELNVKGRSSFENRVNFLSDISLSGALTGTTANFSGNLSAGTANLTGALTGTTGNFSGNLSAGTAYINGYFSAGSSSLGATKLTGLLTGTTANFSGLISGTSAKLSSTFSVAGKSTFNDDIEVKSLDPNNTPGASLRVYGSISSVDSNGNGLSYGTVFKEFNLTSIDPDTPTSIILNSDATVANRIYSERNDLSFDLNGFYGLKTLNLEGNLLISSPSTLNLNSYGQDINSSWVTGYATGKGQNYAALNLQTSASQFIMVGINPTITLDGYENAGAVNQAYCIAPTPCYSYAAKIILTGPGSSITVNGKAVTTSASDRILKSGIEQFSDPIDYIKQLRAVTFNWKKDQSSGETLPGRNFGMIAQEVEQVMPDLNIVSFNPDGTKYIKYDVLSALAIEGIKSQQSQISNLSNAIGSINLETLQSNFDDFKSALDSLSLSTGAGSLIVNSNLNVTGNSLFNNATLTGDLKVGQVKIDSLENDININASSCVDVDGNLNETACDTNKLSFMKNKAGNVDFFNGKAKVNPKGEVLGEKVQAKSFKSSDASSPSASATCSPKDFKFGEEGGKAYIFYCTSDSKWVRSELSSF